MLARDTRTPGRGWGLARSGRKGLGGARLAAVAIALAAIILTPAVALAYVGPGAGFALITTAAALLTSAVVSFLLLLIWPVRRVYLAATRKVPPKEPRIERAVIIGLDGLDPDLVQRLMDEGRLPNLAKIAARGTFRKLGTTFPSMSPVAWSSFATGVNPGKHGIYDFLTRDPKTYLPDLSSAEIRPPERHLKIGRYKIPIGKPQVKLLRRSVPFWKLLDEYRIPSSILRVPITFPADRFAGTMLSAMCVPDLQGTQGSYTYFFTGPVVEKSIGGREIRVESKDGRITGELTGPENPIVPGETLKCPFAVRQVEDGAVLEVGGKQHELAVGKYTDWIEVDFALGLGLKVSGICRFRLIEASPEFKLYVTPINIDPSKPALPISHPQIFSIFLAKLIGRFSTLGLAEDTWALNEGVLDEDAFLDQVDGIHAEREKMFFEMLGRTPRGVLACVFDSTDRVQHMFMRFLDGREAEPAQSKYKDVIPATYARMDEMVGRAMAEIDLDDPRNLLVVMSDHGFKSFRRGVNLNSWLHQNGYLTLLPGRETAGEWFEGVDWTKTKAFALGLGGIFINQKGREAKGIVGAGEETTNLAQEIADKLTGLRDPGEADAVAIREVYPSERIFTGPYRDKAPNLVVGYSAGWRASWDGVRGIVDGVIFDDNNKAWSGDHCIDPKLVPGVLISSMPLAKDEEEPGIEDVAPTLLDLFGLPVPKHMDGHSLA